LGSCIPHLQDHIPLVLMVYHKRAI
jgi:hypothetical protein